MLPNLFCVAVFYMSQVSVCVWSGRESVTIDTLTISGKGERDRKWNSFAKTVYSVLPLYQSSENEIIAWLEVLKTW